VVEPEPEPAVEPEEEAPAFDSVVAGGEGESKSEPAPIEQEPADAEVDAGGEQAEDVADEAVVAEETAPPLVEEQRPPPPPPLVAPQQTPPAQAEKPVQRGDLVELGPGIVQPKRIRLRRIRYPPLAKRLGVEGIVILKVLVSEEGKVEDVQVLRGVEPESAGINGAAVKAAKSSRFEAATKDGVAVKMWITQTIPFKL
jgi:protein TonB